MTLNQMDFVTMGEIKMWTKFKHWLIRKLGGYIAPCSKCNEYKNTLIEITRPVETKRCSYVMYDANYVSTNTQMDIAKMRIANEFAQALNSEGYIKYEYKDDETLRGTLMVVKPV